MGRPIRVLIAEDHDDTREGYATYLERQGMDVRAVPDGVRALKVARRWKPDVAVLDLSMPKLTGDEVARALKKHRADGTAIVVISGYADFGEKRALEAGADEYCGKPCLPHELAAIVERLGRRAVAPDLKNPTEETA
jgi:DNA-binding response OmpR family regulator